MTYSEEDINALLEEAAEGIQMDPRFKDDLRERIRQRRRGDAPRPLAPEPYHVHPPNPRRLRQRRPTPAARLTQSAAVLLFTLLIGFVAWQAAALTGPRYFVPIDANQLSDYQQPPERANVNGVQLWRNLTLDEAHAAVDFRIIQPELGPEWRYAGATVSEGGRALTLTYRQLPGAKLYLTQEVLPPLMQSGSRVPIGLEMTVSEREVDGVMGEYVEGTWNNVLDLDETLHALDLNDRRDVWEPDPTYRTLRWQKGRYLFTVQLFGQPGGTPVTDLARFAESLDLDPEGR